MPSAGVIILAVFILVLLFFCVYNFRSVSGRLRLPTVICNITLGALAVGVILLGVINHSINKSEAENHKSVSGLSLFDWLTYEGSEDGYNLFVQSEFMSPGSHIAIPEADAPLPAITKIYPVVTVFQGPYSRGDDIELAGENYLVWTDAELIRPNFALLALLVSVISVGILFVFNLLVFAVTVRKKKLNEAQN